MCVCVSVIEVGVIDVVLFSPLDVNIVSVGSIDGLVQSKHSILLVELPRQ